MVDNQKIILEIFYEVTGKAVSSCNSNLFSAPNYYTPRDIAYVLLALRETLNINLNHIYPNLKTMTINELVSLIKN